MLVESPLQVARQKAIHNVHARRQALLRHATQNQRLVGGLLRVLAEQHDPARVECTINIVVAAVHVQRMLRQRARAHFEHHRRAFARRVIVLLHAVHHALPRSEIHHPLATHRVCNRAALRRMLAFGLDGNRVAAEYIQVPLCICLLKELAALRRRRNGIKDTGIGNARLSVVADELIAVRSDPDSGITSRFRHSSPYAFLFVFFELLRKPKTGPKFFSFRPLHTSSYERVPFAPTVCQRVLAPAETH